MRKLIRWFTTRFSGADPSPQPPAPATRNIPAVSLEEQLRTLAALGLTLNPGITEEDLLCSYERAEIEANPYDTLLHLFGGESEREPWGRPICDRVWNMDAECIVETGDYSAIVGNLCRVAGMPDLVSGLEDFVDLENETAWLKYSVDGKQRHFTIPVNDDWADADTVSAIMRDIERDGKWFRGMDNGQATIWFYLDEPTAAKLNALIGNALKPSGA